MSLLSALCPSDLFVESLMQCLSLSLCSILRCMVEVPVGAAWRPLSSWLQEIWSFEQLPTLLCFVAWVQLCAPRELQANSHPPQTAGENGRWKCWGCVLNLLPPHGLSDVAILSPCSEANGPLPPAHFPDCRLLGDVERSHAVILRLFMELTDFNEPATAWCDVKHGSY